MHVINSGIRDVKFGENVKVVMVEAMSHTPPDWPMVIT